MAQFVNIMPAGQNPYYLDAGDIAGISQGHRQGGQQIDIDLRSGGQLGWAEENGLTIDHVLGVLAAAGHEFLTIPLRQKEFRTDNYTTTSCHYVSPEALTYAVTSAPENGRCDIKLGYESWLPGMTTSLTTEEKKAVTDILNRTRPDMVRLNPEAAPTTFAAPEDILIDPARVTHIRTDVVTALHFQSGNWLDFRSPAPARPSDEIANGLLESDETLRNAAAIDFSAAWEQAYAQAAIMHRAEERAQAEALNDLGRTLGALTPGLAEFAGATFTHFARPAAIALLVPFESDFRRRRGDDAFLLSVRFKEAASPFPDRPVRYNIDFSSREAMERAVARFTGGAPDAWQPSGPSN